MDRLLTSFTQTLTAEDSKRHIPFPFNVPAGTTRLVIRLGYAPRSSEGINNLLTITLFDPTGWRGAAHRPGPQEVVLDTQTASPGFRPGPLPAGEWIVQIDTHLVMPGAPCTLSLDLETSDESAQGEPRRWTPGKTASRGPSWYRGDVHAHTIHSDAGWDVPDLVAWSRKHKLDFCALTDHSTVSGLPQMLSLSSDDLLTMGGMELTTFHGHALALGVRDWVDWRTDGTGRSIEQIVGEVEAQGGVFIIAHPLHVGDPYCTGCHWEFPTMAPGAAHVVEVWNHGWQGPSHNEEMLELAYRWLDDGCRLALTSGADNHGGNIDALHLGFDVVYAEELSEKEILRGIRQGHLYVSSGPALALTASAGDQQAMMGDVLKVPAGTPVRLDTSWKDCPGDAELSLIADGITREKFRPGEEGSRAWDLEAGQARWCLLTLRAANGEMLALTNPIYLDGRE